ncbi:uncharacterized protein UMAG_01084 [Mycosarcoma maydis]|uniref:Palmitoyltransferase n=1 Tax=Mycosarcoma maydis TaxID=5270 RepID=A0A0D1E9V5_MYCMD|nr:uncharacterized protein UMAG_01084 [Ustilago maydis 521]KIS71175.1 hypothetical protein UMAG_01084 [Ustilago maydis 521]|eukprot:XP_011387045.1 hypothetical protein UMAG_01084 [Ustilago maydis 521]
MAFTCDPKDPRAPNYLKRICRNLRWIPFIFILSLITYAYLTVTISLALRYHLTRKGEWISALFELLFSTTLAGGAIWGFLVAVFKQPGSPIGQRRGDNENCTATNSASAIPPGSEYEMCVEAEEAQSLIQNHDREIDAQANDDAAPLFNVPIPGQPQYPARSGRQQLADLQRLPSLASVSANSSVQRRSNIWVKSSGESRWCAKCDASKPDRTHHCSSCQRCVLRMDHHCPWLANRCVGLRNHKAFFLFITYTALFCIYCCQETARALLRYVEMENNGFETSPIGWAVVLFLGFIFGASLVPFAGYHAWLICKNRTTIESMEGSGRVRLRVQRNHQRPRVEDRLRGIVGSSIGSSTDYRPNQKGNRIGGGRERAGKQSVWRSDEHLSRDERRALKQASKLNVYDVGAFSNWRQVMGDKWYLWFLPIGEPLSDGFSFLVQTTTLEKLEEITASIRARERHVDRRLFSPEDEGHDDDDDSVYDGSRSATRFGYVDSTSGEAMPANSREAGLDRQAGLRFNGAHGEMEWGDAPKKSFVLFGVDEDDDHV